MKLSNPLRYKKAIKVKGNGIFPIDMLRYDSCFPLGEDDALKIQKSVDVNAIVDGRACATIPVDETREIRLVKYSHSPNPLWNEARWRSFGWEIVSYDEYDI